MRNLAADLGVKVGQLFGMIRVAATGKTVSPPLFETLSVLGKARTLERVDEAIASLSRLAELEQ
jgi:glutamyl-tRNA synthetase